MRTLLVEDEPAQRDRMERILCELGLSVTAVSDGDSGLLAHLRSPFELMVLDWVTPGMDGLHLVQRVRTMTGGQQPYILVVTGRDRPADVLAVVDAGADDYLAKPVEPDLLRTRVHIARRRIDREQHHRRAREALAQSEVDFRRVIERCPLGVVAEQDGALVYVNEQATQTLARSRDDLQGCSFADLVEAPFRELARRRSARFERTQVPPPASEMNVVRPNGEVRSVRVIPATAAAYGGDRILFTLLEDVTERDRAERELRLTQYAVDHAADAALWIREDGTITYANHAATMMLGVGRSEVVGAQFAGFVAHDGPRAWSRLRELLLHGRRAHSETAFRRGDGATVPVEILANAVEFDGDRMLIAFARDLTERQKLQAGLQQADRLASVGLLAAGVAHEINNPLAYMIANLELLFEELAQSGSEVISTPEVLRTLAETTDGAHRVRRIVEDLKSFARAEDDGAGAVDVAEVLETSISMASNQLRHRAKLVREHHPVPPVRGNAGRLSQVFLNLLLNAVHAIPEGAPLEHRVSTRVAKGDDGEVIVEVSDTGRGIPPDVIERIFDPFFSTKPGGMGTGLGLSVCHGIVTSMGGSIDVDSTVGRGTRVRLRLPVATEVEERRTEPPPPTIAPSGDAPQCRLAILVVDDEPLICDGIRRALRWHEVDTVSTGTAAVRRCEDRDYDLVLCDVMMPDLAGTEVYRRVAAARPQLARAFVFMTGGAFSPEARAFLESLQNEHIAKPFRLQDLRNLVSRWATGRHP